MLNGSFNVRTYAREHQIGQIMLCVKRNRPAFRRYLEGSLDVRLRQIMDSIMGEKPEVSRLKVGLRENTPAVAHRLAQSPELCSAR